jgi:hypothetical protein
MRWVQKCTHVLRVAIIIIVLTKPITYKEILVKVSN